MDDSEDEYFDDTLVLDDEALASIQATEEKFSASSTQSVPPLAKPTSSTNLVRPDRAPPPAKRLKTSHERSFERSNSTESPYTTMDTMEWNVDVRFGPDGKYIISNQTAGPSRSAVLLTPNEGLMQAQRNVMGRAEPVASARREGVPAARTKLTERKAAAPAMSGKSKPVEVLMRSNENGSLESELDMLKKQVNELKSTNEAMQKSLQEAQETQLLKSGEITILRQTIDKTKKEHSEAIAKARADMLTHEKIKAELQAKLKEETERLATRMIFKQQEVETSTRKPAWGSARTRRINNSTSKRDQATPSRIGSSIEETPTRVSLSQSLLASNLGRRTFRHAVPKQRAPDGGDDMDAPSSSPTRPHQRKPHGQAHASGSAAAVESRTGLEQKKPSFKGFHNAFADTQPLVPSPPKSQRQNLSQVQSQKSQQRMRERDAEDVGSDPFYNLPDGEGDGGGGIEFDTEMANDEGHGEERMEVDHDANQRGGGEEEDEFEDEFEGAIIDIHEELRTLIFTHTAPSSIPDTAMPQLTLQVLLSTPLALNTPSSDKSTYITACETILQTCGAGTPSLAMKYAMADAGAVAKEMYESEMMDKLAGAIWEVARILRLYNCISALAALLDLVVLLNAYFPSFSNASLESLTPQSSSHPMRLLLFLKDIADSGLTLLSPSRDQDDAEKDATDNLEETRQLKRTLTVRLVNMLETTCWNVNDSVVVLLKFVLRPRIMDILLNTSQPAEVTTATLRFLLLFTSRENMSRFLLYPESIMDEMEPKDPNRTQTQIQALVHAENELAGRRRQPSQPQGHISIVEKLCWFLVQELDVSSLSASFETRLLIVAVLSALAGPRNDARSLLAESNHVAPSLIVYITYLSQLIWENELPIVDSKELTIKTMQLLHGSIVTLHTIIFTLGLGPNLGEKLIQAASQPGAFNGLTHLFIVTFGRLSWASLPEWVEEYVGRTHDAMTELAVEIMEAVVAGPECDSLWEVWHSKDSIEFDEGSS